MFIKVKNKLQKKARIKTTCNLRTQNLPLDVWVYFFFNTFIIYLNTEYNSICICEYFGSYFVP